MITKQRYKIAYIPKGAEFQINHQYAKIVDGKLHLFNRDIRAVQDHIDSGSWYNTNQTLSEYNDYQVFEPHELLDLKAILKDFFKWDSSDKYTSSFSWKTWYTFHKKFVHGNTLYVYKNWDDEIYVSYYNPVVKGFKGVNKNTRLSAGETIKLPNKYINLNNVVNDKVIVLSNSVLYEKGKNSNQWFRIGDL